MGAAINDRNEWLEADGLGGFASGTTAGIRTRRYHALLLVASTPPSGRFVLVNGLDAWVQTAGESCALSTQVYAPGVSHPDGIRRIVGFQAEPWPCWTLRLDDGSELEHEIFTPAGIPAVVLRWRLSGRKQPATLLVRLFLSGRDPHALQKENGAFRFEPRDHDGGRLWRAYEGVPGLVVRANAEYLHQPDWYRNFLYSEERARGLDCCEDLASPGILRWDLSKQEAVLLMHAELPEARALPAGTPLAQARAARAGERERRKFPSRLHRAADAYLVRRGSGKTIVAGYPWFGDWGRDTFIALRGFCLATGRLDDAREILLEWAGAVCEGILPNRFPDRGGTPEINSVDASLWYAVAVHEFLAAAKEGRITVSDDDARRLRGTIEAILAAYAGGTRYRIRVDADGLLAAGEPGLQLTWMDAKVGDWVVTARTGKPVEVQALWLNALHIASTFSPRWQALFERGRQSFLARFWNAEGEYLYDVVDAGHQPGMNDATFRPNQIFAAGGLPLALLEGERARKVVDAVERRLWTPLGLRSLAAGEPGYTARYEGGVRERDGAYHQGTVWPWLLGPFVDAWLRVRGGGAEARRVARARFLTPLLQHLDEAGIGHISEIADAEPPHTPRGCPFQAWSVGEALRLDQVVLAAARTRGKKAPRRTAGTAAV